TTIRPAAKGPWHAAFGFCLLSMISPRLSPTFSISNGTAKIQPFPKLTKFFFAFSAFFLQLAMYQ
ncbi:MAG: hypothetical protein IKQ94_07675, partial [Bacteroidales bacterium]|nr:hypothetical protein [Bacteroidales bacterium]